MKLETAVTALKGIGEKTAGYFHKLGIDTIGELLRHYPIGYDRFEKPVPIASLTEGGLSAVKARLSSGISTRRAGRLTISVCTAADGTGTVRMIFFNMPYIRNMIKPDTWYIFRGVASREGSGHKLEHPLVYTPENYEKLLHALQPRYSRTGGLSNKTIVKAVGLALREDLGEREYLPGEILEKYGLPRLGESLMGIHFPENEEVLRNARRRLAFDEFFLFMLRLQRCRQHAKRASNSHPMLQTADTARFLERLPYTLTGAQKRTWEEIEADLQSSRVMNRLVQGDVGSGKTVIAALALLMTAANGYQGALMAPTEALARQHYESLTGLTRRFSLPFVPALLTGSMTAKEKRESYARIEAGEVNVVIGTHALIQEKVNYKNLALVVTDEQHRFGVRQREALAGKGLDAHVLVMSATPIPRTLAIILYGDLQVSLIDELPSDRLPVKNCVAGISYRQSAYRFLEKEIRKGRQAYVICPMTSEGELEGLENVEEYAEKLKNIFPKDIQIAHLHGKMRAAEKNKIMDAFGRGDIDILVSTTVVEVGINVPNATVMMVENAERFGLAQLHQLRGRVGRGKEQSYCIFIHTSKKEETLERLNILAKSNDGFFIAGEDLRLRGPGDLFGVRQSGGMDFRIADIYRDKEELKAAAEAAKALAEEDADLRSERFQPLKNLLDQVYNSMDIQL